MRTAVNLLTHPDFTIDQIIEYTDCAVPSSLYRENMRLALDFFQRVVPRRRLRQPDDAGPWGLRINGTNITLLNWLQAIDFYKSVNPRRSMQRGNPLVAYKSETEKSGQRWGNWYTFPSTASDRLAIPNDQKHQHKFKARTDFTCLESTVSDAYVTWAKCHSSQYRPGGSQQLFIWNAADVLETA